MTKSGRVGVKLAVQFQEVDAAGGEGTTPELSDHMLELCRPLPEVCSRHGEPELARKHASVACKRVQRGLIFRTREVAKYLIEFDWPSCQRCVRVQGWWRRGALAAFLLAVIPVIVLLGVAQSMTPPAPVVAAVVFGGLAMALASMKMLQKSSGLGVVVLATDGSALYVRKADPEFAAQTGGVVTSQEAHSGGSITRREFTTAQSVLALVAVVAAVVLVVMMMTHLGA